MLFAERLRIILSIILLGLLLSLLIDLPIWLVTLPALGSELTIGISTPAVMGVVLIFVTVAGIESLVSTHPSAAGRGWRYRSALWGLPVLVVLLVTFILPVLSPVPLLLGVGVLASGALLGFVLWAQYHTLDRQDPHFTLARQSLWAVVYGLALLLFVVLYGLKVRSLLSATGMGLFSLLLATELLREESPAQAWGYGLLIGLAQGELTWGLNYWGLPALPGGLILLLSFYLLSGLMRERLRGRLVPRVVVEYAVVTVAGLVLILSVFPLTW